MAVNLVPQVGRETAREILETSFAQFQADRAVVGMARHGAPQRGGPGGLRRGDDLPPGRLPGYAAIRNAIRDLEKEASKARARPAAAPRPRSAWRSCASATSSASRPAAAPATPSSSRPQPRRQGRGGRADRPHRGRAGAPADPGRRADPGRAGHARAACPKAFNARNAKSRRDLAATAAGRRCRTSRRPAGARRPTRAARTSGSPSCAARCGRTPATSAPTARTTPGGPSGGGGCGARPTASQRKVDGPHQLGGPHLRPDLRPARPSWATCPPTAPRSPPAGETLRRLYTEKDLLAAECLRHGVWRRLDAAGLAAAVSTLVHEPRRDEGEISPRMPNDEVSDAYTQMVRLWSDLEDREHAHALPLTRRAGRRHGLDDAPLGQRPAARRGAARTARWPRVTSSAGASRSSTCSARSRTRRRSRPWRATARKAVDAVLRGVVAADRLD